MKLSLKDAKPGDIRHKIVSLAITGACVKADKKAEGWEADTTDAGGRYAGFLKGYAGKMMNIDRGLDIIFPGAFGDLGTFLKEGFIAWQHDWSEPIGTPLIAREEYAPNWGLYSEARISKTDAGQKAMTLINDEVVKKLSIGYRLKSGGYSIVNREGLESLMKGWKIPIPLDKQTEVLADFDNRKLDEVWALTEVDLFEWSPVSLPMNGEADITGSKDLGGALDGLPFGYHPLIVATACKGLVERLRKFKEIREGANRKLSPAHRDGLAEVVPVLKEALGIGESLLSELDTQKPESTAETVEGKTGETPTLTTPEESARLYSQFLALESRIVSGAPLT